MPLPGQPHCQRAVRGGNRPDVKLGRSGIWLVQDSRLICHRGNFGYTNAHQISAVLRLWQNPRQNQ